MPLREVGGGVGVLEGALLMSGPGAKVAEGVGNDVPAGIGCGGAIGAATGGGDGGAVAAAAAPPSAAAPARQARLTIASVLGTEKNNADFTRPALERVMRRSSADTLALPDIMLGL